MVGNWDMDGYEMIDAGGVVWNIDEDKWNVAGD
jgi:hypothetical protein